MPTENRSSTIDPRDLFIRLNPLGLDEKDLIKDSTGFEDQRTHSDYLLFLAGYRETHAEPQHHPEPIAWMVGTAIWWQKPGAERDSEERGEPMVPLGPCDSPSEIARLTAQFKDWQASHHRNYCKAADERDELRGQLEQARRLLHTASIRLANWLEPDDDPRKQIIAFLEGAIEPSTLAARYPNRLCHIDYTAHPHRCGCLKGDDEAQRRYDEHFRGASAEPEAT